MRKTYRTSKSARRRTTRNRTTRRTTARVSHRRTTRTRRTTTTKRHTTKRLNSKRRTTTKITKRWPTTTPSPYTQAFITGCRNGQPCATVINTISKRTGKPFNTICASLCKAGVCRGQKFNGQWICWPNFKTATNTTSAKTAQTNLWQGFIDWCVTSGYCTPANLNSKSVTGNQARFMKNCQTLMTRQCTISGTAKIKAAPATTGKTNKTWNPGQSASLAWSRSFGFPTFKTFTRRFARAA